MNDLNNLTRISPDLIGSLNIKPVATDGSGVEAPDNSELRKIAEDVLGAAQMSFAAVAANPDRAVRSGSMESAFKDALKAMPEQKRTHYATRAKTITDIAPEARVTMFGRAGERDFESHLAAGGFERYDDGIAALAIDRKLLGIDNTIRVPRDILRTSSEGLLIPAANLPGGSLESFNNDFESAQERAEASGLVSEDKLEDIWGPSFRSDPFGGAAVEEDDFEEFAVTDKMGFWIRKVKCVDETNPEFWGHDEIALAGISVDETGDTKKIPRKFIGGGFDDGDSKSYSNWRYTWFNMREGQHFPKRYMVSLILAEEDHGGLASALDKIWENVRDRVKEAIAKAVATALEGYLGKAIANAIGQLAGWIVDKLFGWVISWFKDDLFPPFTATVLVPSMSARWHYPNGQWGNPSSGLRTAHFYGHKGHYYIQYFWKFFS